MKDLVDDEPEQHDELPPAPSNGSGAVAAGLLVGRARPGVDGAQALQVAGRLHELAEEQCLRSRSGQLQRLATALEHVDDAYGWSQVDLFAALRPDAVHCEVQRAGLVSRTFLRVLDNIRIPLIFAPIALTWFAVARAVGAYQEMVDAKAPGADASFITLWQSGFDGRLSWERLGSVALLDAGLILLIMVLTFMSHWGRQRLEAADEHETEEHTAELSDALTEATVVLAEVSYSSPVRFREELTGLVVDLNRLTQNVNTAGVAASDSIDRVRAAAEVLGSALADVPDTTRRLTEHVEQVEKMVGDLSVTNARLADGLEPAAAALDLAAHRFADTATRLDGIPSEVSRVAAELNGVVSGVDALVTTSSAGQRMLLDAMAAERASYSETLRELHAASASLGATMGNLDGVTGGIGSVASTVEGLVSGLQSAVASLDAVRARMTNDALQWSAGAETVIQMSGDLSTTSQSQSQVTAQLRDALAETGRLVASLTPAVNQLAVAIKEVPSVSTFGPRPTPRSADGDGR